MVDRTLVTFPVFWCKTCGMIYRGADSTCPRCGMPDAVRLGKQNKSLSFAEKGVILRK
jgi:uncharacterized OB-fold protein